MPGTLQQPALAPDVESGYAAQNHAGPSWSWNTHLVQANASHHGWLTGLVFLLFLAGVVPLSLMIIGLFLLISLAMCCRAYVLHQFAQQLNLTPMGNNSMETALRLLRSPQGLSLLLSGERINVANLRLSLLDRDFTDEDYETLLELDQEVAHSRPQLTEAELSTLRTHVHSSGKAKAKGCGVASQGPERTSGVADKGDAQDCSVCLERYGEGACITTLPCQHAFHTDCIAPWLRQQGTAATCPLCKRIVFG